MCHFIIFYHLSFTIFDITEKSISPGFSKKNMWKKRTFKLRSSDDAIADIYSIFAMSLRLLSQLLLSSLPIMLFTTYFRLQLHLYNLPRELLSRFSNMKYCSNALHYSTRTLTSRVSLLLVRATLLLSPDLLFRVPGAFGTLSRHTRCIFTF